MRDRNLYDVIKTMMAIIPIDDTTLEFARALTKIANDSRYVAPELMGMQWAMTLACITTGIPAPVQGVAAPLWHFQILSAFSTYPLSYYSDLGYVFDTSTITRPEITLNRDAVSKLIRLTMTKDRIEVKIPPAESEEIVKRIMRFADEIAAEAWVPEMNSVRGTFNRNIPEGGFMINLHSDNKELRGFFLEQAYWRLR